MPHIYGKLMALTPIIGTLAMIASIDTYVETLPKMRRAIVAIVLFVLGGFGGGTMVAQFRLDARLDRAERQVNLNTAYITEDRENVAKILESIQELTCDLYDVPNPVCRYWLDNGRPKSLQEPSE